MATADDLLKRENDLHAQLLASGKLAERSENGLAIFRYMPGHDTYYYHERTEKHGILLHYTTGYFSGDLGTLTPTSGHVSVAYLVGRTGRVYELYDPDFWSHHIGRQPYVSTQNYVGIELTNMGPLKPVGGQMNNWYPEGRYERRYCLANEAELYQALERPYRGIAHFATFTDAQYSALDKLLGRLCARYSLPRTFLPPEKRFDLFASPAAARAFRGITSHVNYIGAGKWDIGPAFDWARIGA
jgi:N-acetyl-anhydromuramyl-L-alanine amidase AmpD